MNLSSMMRFLQNGRDKKLRILSINQGINIVWNGRNNVKRLCEYVDKIYEDQGFDGLKEVTYKDMRDNSVDTEFAALFPYAFTHVKHQWEYYNDKKCRGDYIDTFFNFTEFLIVASLLFVFGPILFISKILQILFPWIIVGYLGYYGLLFSNEIDLFQMVMLAVYLGLQLLVLFLGIKVFIIQWWLWHIVPGANRLKLNHVGFMDLEVAVTKYYDSVAWYPQVERIVLEVMGNDIGAIIMEYCKSIHV